MKKTRKEAQGRYRCELTHIATSRKIEKRIDLIVMESPSYFNRDSGEICKSLFKMCNYLPCLPCLLIAIKIILRCVIWLSYLIFRWDQMVRRGRRNCTN